MLRQLLQMSWSSRHSSSVLLYVLHYRPRKYFRISILQHLDIHAQHSFHIFNNHSQNVHTFGNQLDYVRTPDLSSATDSLFEQLGIVILMWGSTIPCVYYGFYCTPHLQKTYYTLVSVLAAGCVYATLHPAFRRPKYRPYRAAMYAGLGLSFIIPIVHGITIFGWETQMWRMSLDWMALMTAFNLTGGALYAMRVRS